jgi:integrase
VTRVELKGIHRVRRRLATGAVKTYYYAWRGGPRIEGEPGTPEFVASFARLSRPAERTGPKDQLQSLLDRFQRSTEFTGLAEKTRRDYVKHIRKIEQEFGDFPIRALAENEARSVFLDWRDKLTGSGKRQADYTMSVLARVLSWSKERGITRVNPLERMGRVYTADRTDKVWTLQDEASFLSIAPEHMRLPLTMALWTGQRQGDLLRLTWSAYDGSTIRLRQSKTRARVVIPVGAPLKAALDDLPRRQTVILLTMDGRPWTQDGFRTSWRKACEKAGVTGLTFHDLRGTAVTRLALAGATEAEIATMTGLSLKTVRDILDKHYLSRDPALAESAVRKLERRWNEGL